MARRPGRCGLGLPGASLDEPPARDAAGKPRTGFGISYIGSTFHAGPIAEKIGLAFKASGGQVTRSIVTLQLLNLRRFDAALSLLVVGNKVAKPTLWAN